MKERKIMANLFQKITESKEALAEYLLKCCDNPLYECNEDMCDICEKPADRECNEKDCLNAIVKGLDSEVG